VVKYLSGLESTRLVQGGAAVIGGVTGLAYGLWRASASSSFVPVPAGLAAGLCAGSIAGVLLAAWRPWERTGSLRTTLTPVIIYFVALVGLAAASGSRLLKPSTDTHFVYLADALNHGQLHLRKRPPHQNDWAKVDVLTLRNGKQIRGRWWRAAGPHSFRSTDGKIQNLPPGSVKRRKVTWYVSFPPLPAALMMPGVLAKGHLFNDVWFTLTIAALNPVLCFLLLGELRRIGASKRTQTDDLWLTMLFCFGTVHFFCSVLGKVWYTAHVLGTTLALGYLLSGLQARSPLMAGLFLGLGFVTRTPLLFAFPYFALQALKPEGPGNGTLRGYFRGVALKPAMKRLAIFGLPVLFIGLLMAWMNWARFDNPFEFGHTYLNIRWAHRIQRWGLFNIHYLPKNLAAAFSLLPHIQTRYPYITISRHGLSLLLVTPIFVYLLWPKIKTALHHPLWIAVGLMAVTHFLYQNSGYVQFSYRFSLDFTPMLIVLLASGNRPLGNLAKGLIFWSVLAHGFGAVTFDRFHQFYSKGDWLFVVS
jgi:hypothetical protein